MRSEYESMKLVPKVTLRELVTNNALRIPLIISLAIMVAQQLSGINAVRIVFKELSVLLDKFYIIFSFIGYFLLH